jgi:N-acetylmuramoyl-L-alanine amidase
MKTAVVIGHHEKSRGAFSIHFGLNEWDFYRQVDLCLMGVTTFFHNPNISSYSQRIKDTANRINKGNFDLVIEMHFNSFHDESANGCETLYFYKSQKAKEYALLFSNLIGRETGIKLRNGGLKALANTKDRGFASVYYTNAPTILIEPFFGSSKSDCDKIKSPENLANIINQYIEIIN